MAKLRHTTSPTTSRALRALVRGGTSLVVAATLIAAVPNPIAGTADGAFDLVAALPPGPTLSFRASEPVLTGSVEHLFSDAMFSGPNRSAKQDRARPAVNVAEFAQDFAPIWEAVAAQRVELAPGFADAAGVAVAARDTSDEAPRITVASVDPAGLGNSGLAAIDSLTDPGLDPSIPRPISVPESLAFARANTPATDFTPSHAFSEREQWCLATGVYFEARGESYRGQVAVAQVIMNRVEDYRYPDTICGVVYQNQSRRNACQFSFACDGIPDRISEPRAWAVAQEVTQEVLNGDIFLTEVAESTHYHANYVRPAWAGNMDRLTQIGLHIFYRFRPGWRFG